MATDPNCIFCKIVTGESPATILHQDDLVTAFLDISPVNPGHTLVIPNNHAPHLAQVEGDWGARMFTVGQRVAQAIRESDLRSEGMNLFLSDGEAAGQVVPHSHLHVIPRYPGDSCGLKLHAGPAESASAEELQEAAEKIKAHL